MDVDKEVVPLNASLTYLKRSPRFDDEIPYRLVNVEPTETVPITNMEFETVQNIPVKDLRDINDRLSLQHDAMKLYTWPSSISHSSCKGDIEKYNREMAECVRKELGAERVFVYDFRFRNSSIQPSGVSGMHKKACERGIEPPLLAVHLDQTREGGKKRISRHLRKDEQAQYFSGLYRLRVINVWRHLNANATPVPHMPLGLCLPNSVAVRDLAASKTITPQKEGESYYVHYNPGHQWYWASKMVADEVLVFATWDSQQPSEQATNCCVHAALMCPWTETAPRESLEIRVIVINTL